MTFTLDTTYHGPATIILSYTLGEILATATNDLFLSTYENTITLPTDPFTGAMTVTKPKVVVAGKLKTGTITLAGKGGIPKHGVGGVLAIITATGLATIKGSQDAVGDGLPELIAITGPSVRLIKKSPGTLSITTVGWWASAPSDTGNLMHKYYTAAQTAGEGQEPRARRSGMCPATPAECCSTCWSPSRRAGSAGCWSPQASTPS